MERASSCCKLLRFFFILTSALDFGDRRRCCTVNVYVHRPAGESQEERREGGCLGNALKQVHTSNLAERVCKQLNN